MNPEQLKSLVDRIPAPDERGTLAGIKAGEVEKVVAELHKGGPDAVTGLIDMLVEPGKGDDIKPHYALHCLAVYVWKVGDGKTRREFADTVASKIGGDRPIGVQKYLVRELQVAGGKEVVPVLGKALLVEELCEPAAQALVAIGDGAAEQLRAALPKVQGKCRLTVIQNLGAVADAGSTGALKKALGDEDRDIRVAALWGLVAVGDPGSVDAVLNADDKDGYERTQATDACMSLADKLMATGRKDAAKKIYSHLQKTRTDPSEQYVREAIDKALAGA